jgi:tRNA(Ile)-lysidine synthase
MPDATTNRLSSIVQDNLARLGGVGPGVLAVSGGADSVALLRALADLAPTRTFVVAHLNHQLRGKDSDADAEFVAKLCPHLIHLTESIDVAKLSSETGENLEATARRARYDFLADISRKSGSRWVATAHTHDDQVETILHRLIRGAGIRGLRGIAEQRPLAPGIRLLRPMLNVSRVDVIEFLNGLGQTWREDATNQDTVFTRNRIRHELLPMLRSYNPGIEQALSLLSEQAIEVHIETQDRVDGILQWAEKPRAGQLLIFDAERLEDEPDRYVREMLVTIWEREGWPRDGMTHEHWKRAADVALGRAKAWDLPGRLRIVARGNIIQVGPATAFTS